MNILIIFGIFAIPALSLFIKKTYEPDMIFRRFYLLMIWHWIKTWRKKDRYKRYLIKPFICIYCYNTWLTIIFFSIIGTNFFYLPLFIGLTYLNLEIFNKLIT